MSGRDDEGSDHLASLSSGRVRAEKSRLANRLRSIGLHSRALEAALEDNFPDGFSQRSWEEAFESDEPRDANRCVVVVGDYSTIVNALAEMLKSAASKRLLGLLDYQRPRADDVFNVVCEDGGISRHQAQVLRELYRLEGRLEHLSPDVSADEVFEAIESLRQELPDLVKSIGSWLDTRGISFP